MSGSTKVTWTRLTILWENSEGRDNMNPKVINVDMNKKLIMRMYIGFVVTVGLVFGIGMYIIDRQQAMIDKQQQIIEKQEQTIIHNSNTIESLKDKIDELLHKSEK